MTKDQHRLSDAISSTKAAAERLRQSIGLRLHVVAAAIDSDRPDVEEAEALDAFVQRFQQVVEHMTHRLYPAIYRIAQGERAPFIGTLLNEFEGSGLLSSATAWQIRLELRNRLVHEYPLFPADRAIALRSAVTESELMLADLDCALAIIDKQQWLKAV